MEKTLSIGHILLNAGYHGLRIQAENGAMPEGCNGPYRDPEHPVRNTSHWLYLFSHLYEKTGETCWKSASEKAIEYILCNEVRPFGKTFYCRDKKDKDRCNGLVGQAWVIEALAKASAVFNREDCYKTAEDTFLLHPFDTKLSIWHRVDIDGKILDFDFTFNHQLWFASAGAMLARSPSVLKRSHAFLADVASRVQLYPDGTIFHASPLIRLFHSPQYGFTRFLKELKLKFNKKRLQLLYPKSAGYHGFNLYALSMLKQVFPNEDIWKGNRFSKILNVRSNTGFQAELLKSQFGYKYNISGIEIAFAVQTFLNDSKEVKFWIEKQLKETYKSDNSILTNGVIDENTAMARIYQAARLNWDIKVTI